MLLTSRHPCALSQSLINAPAGLSSRMSPLVLAGTMVSVIALIANSSSTLAEEKCVKEEQCRKHEPSKVFDLKTSGYLTFGLRAAEEDARLSDAAADRDHEFFTDSELSFKAEIAPNKKYLPPCGETRPLLRAPKKFGAEIQFKADADVDYVNVDEAYTYLENGFGKIEVGRNDGAEDFMALGADTIATGTGGINGDFEGLGTLDITDSGDAAKITYLTPQFKYRDKTPEEMNYPNKEPKKG